MAVNNWYGDNWYPLYMVIQIYINYQHCELNFNNFSVKPLKKPLSCPAQYNNDVNKISLKASSHIDNF